MQLWIHGKASRIRVWGSNLWQEGTSSGFCRERSGLAGFPGNLRIQAILWCLSDSFEGLYKWVLPSPSN